MSPTPTPTPTPTPSLLPSPSSVAHPSVDPTTWGLTNSQWSAVSAMGTVAGALFTLAAAVIAGVIAWKVHQQSGPVPRLSIASQSSMSQRNMEEVKLTQHVLTVTVSNAGRTAFTAYRPTFYPSQIATEEDARNGQIRLQFEGPERVEVGADAIWTCDITHIARRLLNFDSTDEAMVTVETSASGKPLTLKVSLTPNPDTMKPFFLTEPHSPS